MNKIILSVALVATSLLFTSCFGAGTTGTTTTGTTTTTTPTSTGSTVGSDVLSAGTSILGDLIGGLLSKTITEKTFVGTWTYQTPEVRFESENLLAKAGGSVMASSIKQKLDSYLSKVGITKGVTTFTFKDDKSYTIQTKGRVISSGTYTYDRNTQTLKMQGTFGLLNQECFVGMDGTNLCLLYEADKLLTVLNSAASILGQANSTLGSVASVFGNNYNGMKVGFSLSK